MTSKGYKSKKKRQEEDEEEARILFGALGALVFMHLYVQKKIVEQYLKEHGY